MKESAFQGWVVDVFEAHGWTVKHAPVPMRAVGGGRFVPDARGRGLLDLTMTHPDPPRAIWAECKNESGVLSDAQKAMFRALLAVVESVREICRPAGIVCPIGVFVFAPGSEKLVEAIARGADVPVAA